ncbi:Glycosyltransferase [Rhodovastum atsumiense]|uniref:Glycosyltransferase n=1 Tax=Rhodovastum atsumiense TaxID=504468 RepID=A0A5M6J2Q8_9PROT|nr:glycosyltransferase family 2 protein [Rhodovastum atsumiense]KAA5613905.1 glycosyltransferase [Rhodovastum atsumiense]CAH2602033.1 Glycosyltransferase [Rhodovastum atsumiense]
MRDQEGPPQDARTGPGPQVAVIIPCLNEARTIAKVVTDFRAALPGATVHVYDNNSSDQSARLAREAGAVVAREALQGKGNVVRRAFANVEADVYVLVDGDDTYAATAAPAMVWMLLEHQLDMVTGVRVDDTPGAYRRGHRLGNRVLTALVGHLFGPRISDMLSGYRVFSRRFVKSFPAIATGFETETEFSVHALQLLMPIDEMPTPYRERPAGSISKLRTWPDGWRILHTIIILLKEERPLEFFAASGAALLVGGIGLGMPVVVDFIHTGLVPRLPTAVLATGLVLLSFLSLTCGLILDSVARGRKENRRFHYLAIPPVPAPSAGRCPAPHQGAALDPHHAQACSARRAMRPLDPIH